MAESDLIRGNVDTVILKVLYEGDRYGYDLIKQINARSDGQWEIKQPTVYACLKRLEKQGFISSYWDSSESDGGRRKYYTLTESGKEVFLKYKNEFERATALFGGLISDAEPVFKQDDYSDVEDEFYTVSKRPRPKRKKEVKKPDPEPEPIIEQAPVTPSDYDTVTIFGNNDSVLPLFDDSAQTTDTPAPETSSDPAMVIEDRLEQQEQKSEGVVILDEAEKEQTVEEKETEQENLEDAEYINDLVSLAESIADSNAEIEAMENAKNTQTPSMREPLDPRSIIDSYYNSERGESYSDVHANTRYVPQKQDERPAPPPAPVAVKQPAPIASTAPRPEPVSPAPKISTIGFPDPDESQARREYKSVLSELVERLEVTEPVVKEDPPEATPEEVAAVTSVNEADKQFIKVKNTARDLGDDVQVIAHNNSAKQYAHKYYYYSNRLMMTHYTIMCVAMFVIGLTMFLTFYAGLKLRMPYDYLLYMAAGLLPIIMFIIAVMKYAGEPDKRKRININFTSSIFIRCIIMLQVAVIIYCINLIWGMPVGFSYNYLPSLLIPLAYSLFIPIGKVIFMTLLQSGNYAVE